MKKISTKKTSQAKSQVPGKQQQHTHRQQQHHQKNTEKEYAGTSTTTATKITTTKVPKDSSKVISGIRNEQTCSNILQEDKSEEIKFLAGPSSIQRVEDDEVSARNSGELRSSTIDIESDRVVGQHDDAPSSFIIFPLPQNSEDVKNENHLRLARIFDTSIWELPTDESRHVPETVHNLTGETGSPSVASALNLRTCSNHNLINDESNLPSFPTTETSLVSNAIPHTTTTTTITNAIKSTEDGEMNCGMNEEETSTAELDEVEGRRHMHVLAVWPTQNGDFDLLTKLDDETTDFCPSHEISDIFNPVEWFRDDLGDDDIPAGRRLNKQPGKFCLTTVNGESNISQDFETENAK